MKFKFRLDILMRQRKVEQDVAQREYSNAKKIVDDQMLLIKNLYEELDGARLNSQEVQQVGGTCSPKLVQIEEFLNGQKIKIDLARQKARLLMQEAEAKHEVLIERAKEYKIIERLKEKKQAEHKKARGRMLDKQIDDITTMRFGQRGNE